MRSNTIAAVFLLVVLLGGCAHLDDETTAPILAWNDPVVGHAERPPADAWAPSVHPASYDEPADLKPRSSPYTLDTGDRLRVFVYGEPNLSRLYTVDSEGRIAVPLIGNVRARGRTTAGLAGAIKARLGARYVRDPQVTVDINQHRPFYILGEVRNAGQYAFAGGITVEAAVAIAGGYTERANETKMRITRRVNGNSEVIEVTPEFHVRPGDTIYITERFF